MGKIHTNFTNTGSQHAVLLDGNVTILYDPKKGLLDDTQVMIHDILDTLSTSPENITVA